MSDTGQKTTTPNFAEEWQSWLLLRHFLSASAQRQLVIEIIAAVTRDKVSFNDLFEELHVSEPLWNECWAVRPLAGVKGYAGALQNWIRDLVWQNDDSHSFGSIDENSQESEFLHPDLLPAITHMGWMDFGATNDQLNSFAERFRNHLQPTFIAILKAFQVAKDQQHDTAEVFWQRVIAETQAVPMPLQAIMLKHIADLLGDVDSWRHAAKGYEIVRLMFDSWSPPQSFYDLGEAWRAIVTQSNVTATAIIESRSESAIALVEAAERSDLATNPTLAINLGVDAATIWQRANNEYRDPRVALLWTPLHQAVHDVGPALIYSSKGKHEKASRRYWAILRRQIALGSSSEVRTTKAYYALNLLRGSIEKPDVQDSAVHFVLGIRLLLESGQRDAVEQVDWKRQILAEFVAKDHLIADLISRANAYAGAKVERTQVLLEIFKSWTTKLSPLHDAIAVRMWTYIANVANDFEADFNSACDAGRPALKALRQLGLSRPELRDRVGTLVATAVCTKLHQNFAWGQVDAIEAALAYVDAFEHSAFISVVTATLEVLEGQSAESSFWPLSRGALRFLVDHNVRVRCGREDGINARALKQILRFGLAQNEEQPLVFFHLADFDTTLLEAEDVKSQFHDRLEKTMAGAVDVNASTATNHIQALLVAPAIAGAAGVETAIRGIRLIMQSAGAERPSLGLANLDRVLLVLTEQLDTIRRVLRPPHEWLDEALQRLVPAIGDLWSEAANRPIIFAPFSLPPKTRPSSILVHNCAFACLQFAREIGKEAQVLESLENASHSHELRSAILLARATRGSSEALARDELEISSMQDRDAFYPTVGRRVAQLQHLPREDAVTLCRGLVQNCLRLGPDPADAALLVTAATLGLHEFVRQCGLSDYITRVRADADWRQLLLPIVSLFVLNAPAQT